MSAVVELSHEEAWKACNQVVRLWVSGVASAFGAEPERTWLGDRIGRLLLDFLDQTDVQLDHFELPSSEPGEPPSAPLS